MKHVAIIGNGIAGISAARHIRKNSDYRITVISSEHRYFFSRTALMYVYMGHMKFEHTEPYEAWFWEKNNIDLICDHVTHIDFEAKRLHFANQTETLPYDDLLLATGSQPNKFVWPGQDLDGVQGLYSKQDLEMLERNTPGTTSAVVVGGGLIGIELAEMLASRGIEVHLLVREQGFWSNVLPRQESELISRHIREHHVHLHLETNLKEILPDDNGRARAVTTDHGEEIPCQIVGLTPGVHPNLDLVKDGPIETDKGILVNRYLETNIPNVYALGDCAQQRERIGNRPPVEAVWYTGRLMGETVAQTITGNRLPYSPGNWFNSAKFMDIEYQTYGWVFPQLKEGQEDFYWEHPNGRQALHFVYDAASRQFTGVNTFGIRLRHEVMDRFLSEERSVEHVLEHLRDALFDPEFYKTNVKRILAEYNRQNGTQIKPRKRNWKFIMETLAK